jgi:hypothetical protein
VRQLQQVQEEFAALTAGEACCVRRVEGGGIRKRISQERGAATAAGAGAVYGTNSTSDRKALLGHAVEK